MANKNQYIATSLLLIVVLIAGYFGIKLPNPGVPEPLPYVVVEDGAGGVGTRSAIGRAIQFDRNVRLAQDLAVVGDVAVTGAQTVGGALTVTGAITGGTLACTSASWPVNVVITGTTDIDGATTITGTTTLKADLAMTQTNAAGGSANPFDYTATLGIMNGSDDFTLFDVNMTNADHTGSNTVQILDVANITGDAQATESAIKIGTGWDAGFVNGSATDLNAAVTIDGGLTNVGGGTFATADGDNDVGIDGDLEVNAAAVLDGVLTVGGAATIGDNGDTVAVNSSDWDISTTGAMTGIGAITADGAVALASTLTVTGTLTSTGFVAYSPEGAVTVTAGSTITPTGTYQVISSGGAVTCSTTTCIADADTPGTLLILYNNNASDTITIDGTGGNVECKTDIVLGPKDTILLIWNATDWVCLANHDN